jgi:uncharacterized radical SAM superfamily protein
MAGYPHVSKVQDPAARAALTNAFELITALTNQLTELQAVVLQPVNGVVDLQGARLANLAQPQAETDATNLAYARQLIEAQVESFGGP